MCMCMYTHIYIHTAVWAGYHHPPIQWPNRFMDECQKGNLAAVACHGGLGLLGSLVVLSSFVVVFLCLLSFVFSVSFASHGCACSHFPLRWWRVVACFASLSCCLSSSRRPSLFAVVCSLSSFSALCVAWLRMLPLLSSEVASSGLFRSCLFVLVCRPPPLFFVLFFDAHSLPGSQSAIAPGYQSAQATSRPLCLAPYRLCLAISRPLCQATSR